MFCPHCGKPRAANDTRCPHCTQPLTGQAAAGSSPITQNQALLMACAAVLIIGLLLTCLALRDGHTPPPAATSMTVGTLSDSAGAPANEPAAVAGPAPQGDIARDQIEQAMASYGDVVPEYLQDDTVPGSTGLSGGLGGNSP